MTIRLTECMHKQHFLSFLYYRETVINMQESYISLLCLVQKNCCHVEKIQNGLFTLSLEKIYSLVKEKFFFSVAAKNIVK